MKRSAALSWPRLLTGVALALLVREFAAPAQAMASCGDYVTSGNHSDQFPGSSTAPNIPVRPPPCSGRTHQDPPAPGQPPCRGPSCSGNPALPTAPLSTHSTGGPQRLDCLLSSPTTPVADGVAVPWDDAPGRPVRRASS